MKKIQDFAGFVFIACSTLLAFIAILGIWDILADDAVEKSAQTIGLLAVVAIIVTIAGNFFDYRQQGEVVYADPNATPVVNHAFTAIRHFTVILLILAVSLLALIGVLAIWEVLAGEVLTKSLASISVVAFASFIIVLTCLQREQRQIMHTKLSGWVWALIIIFTVPFMFNILGMLFW